MKCQSIKSINYFVVAFYFAIISFNTDNCDDNFRRMPRPAQLSMYRDYLTMWEAWTNMAEDALNALNQELS